MPGMCPLTAVLPWALYRASLAVRIKLVAQRGEKSGTVYMQMFSHRPEDRLTLHYMLIIQIYLFFIVEALIPPL